MYIYIERRYIALAPDLGRLLPGEVAGVPHFASRKSESTAAEAVLANDSRAALGGLQV